MGHGLGQADVHAKSMSDGRTNHGHGKKLHCSYKCENIIPIALILFRLGGII